jgi:hypothetical protein
LRARGGEALQKQVPHNKGQSVLLNPSFASCLYTARYFYVEHQIKKWKVDNIQASVKKRSMQGKTFRRQWDTEKEKDPKFSEVFEKKAGTTQREQRGLKRNWLTP